MTTNPSNNQLPVRSPYESLSGLGIPDPEELKVAKVVSRYRLGDGLQGVLKSKFFRALLISGLAVVALFTVYNMLLGIAPPTWMIAAVAVGGFAVGLLIQLPFAKGLQKTQFEIAAIKRLAHKKIYDEIVKVGEAKIFLGALPNRVASHGEDLVKEEEIGAVLSLNENWELEPHGLSLPYKPMDWKEIGVTCQTIEVKDHTLLNDRDLTKGADFIHQQMQEGKNVYVHCRAGCGRSAMAVAAYLIKYQSMTAQEAADLIKEKRPCSTIQKKLERLQEFETTLSVSKSKTPLTPDDLNKLLIGKQYLVAINEKNQKTLIFRNIGNIIQTETDAVKIVRWTWVLEKKGYSRRGGDHIFSYVPPPPKK